MAITRLLHSVTELVAVCTKHVSRAAKKLGSHQTVTKLAQAKRRAALPILSRGASFVPFLGSKKNKDEEEEKSKISEEDKAARSDNEKKEEQEEEEDGLWRRRILMGEKCQPLDFAGVIYYDSNGKQLSEIPTPRSPLRSPLPSLAFNPVTVQAEKEAVN